MVGIDIPVPDHIVESIPLVGGNGQFCPDIEPFTGVFVDLLVSDFYADVLEMVSWDGCKAGQIASAPRTEDCIGCKRCETACPTDFLSVRVYLGGETTRSLGLAY